MTPKPPGTVSFDFSHEADTCDTLGMVVISETAEIPLSAWDSLNIPKPTTWRRIRRAITGRPIDTEE
jgi:hypothetical protein